MIDQRNIEEKAIGEAPFGARSRTSASARATRRRPHRPHIRKLQKSVRRVGWSFIRIQLCSRSRFRQGRVQAGDGLARRGVLGALQAADGLEAHGVPAAGSLALGVPWVAAAAPHGVSAARSLTLGVPWVGPLADARGSMSRRQNQHGHGRPLLRSRSITSSTGWGYVRPARNAASRRRSAFRLDSLHDAMREPMHPTTPVRPVQRLPGVGLFQMKWTRREMWDDMVISQRAGPVGPHIVLSTLYHGIPPMVTKSRRSAAPN